MYTSENFPLYEYDSSDDNNNNYFIFVSITSSSLESPLLIGDTYRKLSKIIYRNVL